MARKKRHPAHDEHPSEAWLIPYADILTLLLALFIVLFAVSQTDQKKMQEMAQAFTAAFNAGGPSFFEKSGQSDYQSAQMPNSDSADNLAYLQESNQLLETQQQLNEYIKEGGWEDSLSTSLTEDGLLIRIKEKALFPSGSAALLPQSQAIGKPVADFLAAIPQRIIISGHTDNLPIATAMFPSNWDLSAHRSLNFMKFILSQNDKLNPARFSTVGNGEYRPVASNDTEEGRAQNRRVEILIMRTYNDHIPTTNL